jgi:MFS family permease
MYGLRRVAAVGLLAISVAMTGFNLASLFLPGTELLVDRPDPFTAILFSLIFLAYPVVGFVVAARRPDHPVGWLLMAVGLMVTTSVFSTEYAGRALILDAPLPAAELVAWAGGWSWFVAAGIALPLAIALFPSGRFPGAGWRRGFLVLTALVVVVATAYAVLPGDLEGWAGLVRNPLGLEGIPGEVARTVNGIGTPLLVAMAALAIGSVVHRLRTSPGPQRQQLKWLLLPAAIFLAGLFASSLTFNVEPVNTISWTISLIGLASLPVAVGIAILRYRMFDIDLVIRRTLVYSLVVGVLAAAYAGIVLALQAPLSGVTGGGPLSVAASTMAVAALFGPVRSHVRRIVDRRFYRARYDAARTVDAFAARLREEVEIESVGTTLATAAARTVQPASIGVWIRERGSA